MITQERLHELLSYDEETGVFIRKVRTSTRIKVGDIAGYKNQGYILISLDNKIYSAHRLVWLYVHGFFPDKGIDHVNGDRMDNRLCNLRLATQSQNLANQGVSKGNKSGLKGVYWSGRIGRWIAMCRVNGKQHYLGSYDTSDKASWAYKRFAKKHHGEFYRPT